MTSIEDFKNKCSMVKLYGKGIVRVTPEIVKKSGIPIGHTTPA